MEITNADRVVYPEERITKGDVAAYYVSVADRLLPYIVDRPLTIERFPKGLAAPGFMQKNVPSHAPSFIRRIEFDRRNGKTTFPLVDDVEGLLFFVNLGALTFHVPTATVAHAGHPDWLVWDLDPPEDAFELVRASAMALGELALSFGIDTMPLASGSKGYHLRARVVPDVSADLVDHVARAVSELAVREFPELMTTAFRKTERAGRVFIDWLRNTSHATSVAPFSLRPRETAPVAVPLAWSELQGVDPDAIHLGEAVDRIDPWDRMEPLDLAGLTPAVEKALTSASITLEPFDRFRS